MHRHPRLETSTSAQLLLTALRRQSNCLNSLTLVPCRLAELAPNVIITQDQCRVCAVSEPQLREAVDSWAAACQVRFISDGRLQVARLELPAQRQLLVCH